jgi:hypothetical protein
MMAGIRYAGPMRLRKNVPVVKNTPRLCEPDYRRKRPKMAFDAELEYGKIL